MARAESLFEDQAGPQTVAQTVLPSVCPQLTAPEQIIPAAERLRQLVDDHYRSVYGFAYRLTGSAADGEDLTQHAFLVAQQKLDQLQDPQRVRGWLFAIVRNRYFKQYRAEQFHYALPDDYDLPAADCAAERGQVAEFDSEDLQGALDRLPEIFRSPLILFYFGELSYQEIAGTLEIPLGTVMSRLSRGRLSLKQLLLSSRSPQPVVDAPQRTSVPRNTRSVLRTPAPEWLS